MKMSTEADVIPKDNNELVRVYAPFVTRLILKYNTVAMNTDDLVQHVWTKMIETDIIAKYHASHGYLPKQLTGLQAASYLQMTWGQFKVAIWRGLFGDKLASSSTMPRAIKDAVFARDHGVCHEACHGDTPFDTKEFEAKLASLKASSTEEYLKMRKQMVDAASISLNEKVFWAVDRIPDSKASGVDKYRTVCLFCMDRRRKAQGIEKVARRSSERFTPHPVKGGWASKKALYEMSDIERFKDIREGLSRRVPHYEIFLTLAERKTPFKMYLAKTVRNTYSNWCRTRSRRYKELYLAPMEDGSSWESFLEDSVSDSQEAKVIMNEQVNEDLDRVIEKIGSALKKRDLTKEDLYARLRDGHSLTDLVKELNLPRAVLSLVEHRYG